MRLWSLHLEMNHFASSASQTWEVKFTLIQLFDTCPGSTEAAKCKGCGWPICPNCNEVTDGSEGGRQNVEIGNGFVEEGNDEKEVRIEPGCGDAHREECLLFQERCVKPTLVEKGQRHWLYPALGVIR